MRNKISKIIRKKKKNERNTGINENRLYRYMERTSEWKCQGKTITDIVEKMCNFFIVRAASRAVSFDVCLGC